MAGISKLVGGKPSGSLGVNILLLTAGGVLIFSGIRGVSLVDAAQGKAPAPDSQSGSNQSTTDSSGSATGTPTGGITMMDGKKVPTWIADELKWARAHGWKGRVSSGVRNKAEQIAAATSYGLQHYPNGPLASNHYEGNGVNYPHGAVDVTEYSQLNSVLKLKPGGTRLVWAGPTIGDYVHFSANGH